jgi:hypothetical protein
MLVFVFMWGVIFSIHVLYLSFISVTELVGYCMKSEKVFCSLTCAIIRAKPCYSVSPVICCWKHIMRGIWISFGLCLILFYEASCIVCVTYPWWTNGLWQELHSSDRNHQHCQLLNISSSLKKIFDDSYVWMQKFITTAFKRFWSYCTWNHK